jgi:hypothetical protein
MMPSFILGERFLHHSNASCWSFLAEAKCCGVRQVEEGASKAKGGLDDAGRAVKDKARDLEHTGKHAVHVVEEKGRHALGQTQDAGRHVGRHADEKGHQAKEKIRHIVDDEKSNTEFTWKKVRTWRFSCQII